MQSWSLFLESATDKIIFECVDTALSRSEFLDKSNFYHMLETSYGIKPESIGKNYETFHTALSNVLGVNHYSVERAILKIMKQRTSEGLYSHPDEITAFSKITAVYMKETDANIRRIKELTNLEKYTKHLEVKVKEADDKMKSVERLTAIGETAAMVGHDIRNPLQAITGDLYLVQEDLKLLQGDKQSIFESINSINENIGYINKIVADLQDYAKPLNPELKDVDIAEFFEGLLAAVYVPETIELELDLKVNKKVKTDPMFLRRALTNLITNAIQAMPKGGKMAISASITAQRFCIAVSDTGKGIPPELKQKMFTPLVTTKSKGQGLGLAVVKRLIEALKGSITFESKEGVGTKFIVELPA